MLTDLLHPLGDPHVNLKKTLPTTSALLGTDLLMSPIQRTQQNQVSRLRYMPFGHHPQLPITVAGFTGEPREPKTNQYLLGNGTRPYSAALMRFTAPDSSSPFDSGGMNSYCYCGAQPITRSDPSGMAWVAALGVLMLGSGVASLTVGLVKPAGMSDEVGNALMGFGGLMILGSVGLVAIEGVRSAALRSRRRLPTNGIPMSTRSRPSQNRLGNIDLDAVRADLSRNPPAKRKVVHNLFRYKGMRPITANEERNWTSPFLTKRTDRFNQ